MKAAVVPKIDDKWEVREVSTPQSSANQVLIEIHAGGLYAIQTYISLKADYETNLVPYLVISAVYFSSTLKEHMPLLSKRSVL
jgi:hypothetical protein